MKRWNKNLIIACFLLISVSSAFGGDVISEVDAALMQAETTTLRLASNRGMLLSTTSKGGEDTYDATGELSITKGKGTIDLQFTITESYADITSARVEMDAFDVDFSSGEKDIVYFNGTELGRLTGGNQIWNENGFVVPPTLIKSGVNSLRISVDVDNGNWVTRIGWAKLYVTGDTFRINASDGTEPQSVLIEWDDIDDIYCLYRADTRDGEYKIIAQDIQGTSYVDKDVLYGRSFWYYVVATNSGRTSNKDSGYANCNSDEPRIESIKCASLWLTGEGPYNMRLYWNDFNHEQYIIDSIEFIIDGGTRSSSWHGKAIISGGDLQFAYATQDEHECTVSDISNMASHLRDRASGDAMLIPNGSHGIYAVIANVYYHSAKGTTDKGMSVQSSMGIATVFFKKYGKKNDIKGELANWFRYWFRDGAIKLNNVELNQPHIYNTGVCDFDGLSGRIYYQEGNKGVKGRQCTKYKIDKPIYKDFPKLIEGIEHPHIFVTDYAACRGARYNVEYYNGAAGTVGEKGAIGIEALAQVCSHEQRHYEIGLAYDMPNKVVLMGVKPKPNEDERYETIEELIEEVVDSIAREDSPEGRQYLSALLDLQTNGNYDWDSDGDGILDEDERRGRYGLVSNPYDADSHKFFELNKDRFLQEERSYFFGLWSDNIYDTQYKLYGDNEVCARLAERIPADTNTALDYAFPGHNISSKFSEYYPHTFGTFQGWLDQEDDGTTPECKEQTRLQRDCFDGPRTSRMLLSNSVVGRTNVLTTNASGLSFSETGTLLSLPEYQEDKFSDVVDLISIVASEPLYDSDTGLISKLSCLATVTNKTDEAETVGIQAYLVDEQNHPIAWARNVTYVEPNNLGESRLEFDSVVLPKNSAKAYYVRFVSLENPFCDIITWNAMIKTDFLLAKDIPVDLLARRSVELNKDIAYEYLTNGDLCVYIPATINIPGDYNLQATLEGMNSAFICASSISNHYDVGESILEFVFDGASIRRTGIDGPYQVSSIRVFSGESVVAQSDRFYITNEYKANDFGVEPMMLLVDGASWRREDGAIGADGLIDELHFGIVATNTLPDAVVYRVHAILKGANNYPAAVYSEDVQLAPGENAVAISFSGCDILSSCAGGPYYVSEVSFIPVAESGEEAYARISMEPLEIADDAFGGKMLELNGDISVRENPSLGIAAYVDIPLNVMRVGDVEASFLVTDANGVCAATVSTNVTFSSIGELTLSLSLPTDGLTAWELGGDGYDIKGLLIKDKKGNCEERVPNVCSGLVYKIGEAIFTYESDPEYDWVKITGINDTIAGGEVVRLVIPYKIGGLTVKNIGESALAWRSRLNYVYMEDGEEKLFISPNAFRFSCVRTVILPQRVSYISSGAFAYCSSLEQLILPEADISISGTAFEHCDALIDENGFGIINGLLYKYNGAGGEVIIPYGVKTIGDKAFEDCENITSVAIPDTVASIGNYAFYNCSNISKVVHSSNIPSVPNGAFSHCWGLANDGFIIVNNILFGYNGDAENVVIPDGVVIIDSSVFYQNTKIKSVSIPSSVKRIESSVFEGCTGLTSVVIPEGVKTLSDYTFYGCSSLQQVSIPASVNEIDRWVFSGCSKLSEIFFSGNAPKIDPYVYYGNRLSTFYKVPYSCRVYVHKESTGWGVDIPGKWNDMRIAYYPEECDGYEIGDTIVWANTNTAQQIWRDDAINEANFEFVIPSTTRLPEGSVIRIKSIKLASLNETFTGWDVATNQNDPYYVRLNGVNSEKYVFDGYIASNVDTTDCMLSYRFTNDCDIVVGKHYIPVEGNNIGTNGNGLALLHSNGKLLFGNGADRASLRYVKASDSASQVISTATAQDVSGDAGYYPVYEIEGEVVSLKSASLLESPAFEYSAILSNHKITSLPDGWFNGETWFYAETPMNTNLRIGPAEDTRYVLQTSKETYPYRDVDARTNSFSLALYADVSAMPSNGRAVMVALGNSGTDCAILFRDGDFIRLGFIDTAGNIIGTFASVDFKRGYHLYCGTCDPVSGTVALSIDGGARDYGSANRSVSLGNGFQLGSIYYGLTGDFVHGPDMAIVKLLGYDAELGDTEIKSLASVYPAVTSIDAILSNINDDSIITVQDGQTVTLDAGMDHLSSLVLNGGRAIVKLTTEQELNGYDASNICSTNKEALNFVCYDGSVVPSDRIEYLQDNGIWMYKLKPCLLPKVDYWATEEIITNIFASYTDAKHLNENIATRAEYIIYRDWAFNYVQDIALSPYAWTAFALDAPNMIDRTTPIEEDNIKLGELKQEGSDGKFSIEVGIDGVNIGESAQEARLLKVFGLEGAFELDAAKFSNENLLLTSGERTKDGKIKLSVKPKEPTNGNGNAFFIRARVNQ